MKKTIIIVAIFILTGLLGGVGYAMNSQARPVSPVPTKIAGENTQPVRQNEVTQDKKEIGLPQTLRIPKINVNTTIEHVGLDKEKKMDVPKEVMNVGWYNLGPRPGMTGNSAIDGHVDTPTGAPAIFYNLKKLKAGDRIEVVDENNRTHTFAVTDVIDYQTNEFPIQEVFGPTDKTRLNLITCGGIWDKVKKDYSERTVVYSELITN
jgi:sortase A